MEKEQSSVICPYDKSHIIHKSRIQRHLVKCSQNFPPNYLEKCPFNATHLMFASELASHIEQCPDRKYVASERYLLEIKNHGSFQSCQPSKAESCADIYSDIWEDNEGSVNDFKSNSSVISDVSLILPSKAMVNRPPHGYSETMMLDLTEESNVEDIKSVTSSMGVGRGKIMNRRSYKSSNSLRVGKGKGNIIGEMKAGASAISDIEDTESVISNTSHDSLNYEMYKKNLGKFDRDSIMRDNNRILENDSYEM